MAFIDKEKRIITSKIEHPSILNPCRQLEEQGVEVHYLDVDRLGRIDMDDLEAQITESTALISLQHANSETGVLQNIKRASEIARNKGVLFHTDAVQSVAKMPFDLKDYPVDLLSISAHKFYGPKGIETAFTLTPVAAAQTATSTEIRTADNSGMSMDCQASLDCYTPSIVTVSVGDVVTMINSDSTAAMHSFTAGSVDGFTPSPSGTFDTGIMSADDTFEWTPETSGEVPYYCLLHTWMQGTIIVE